MSRPLSERISYAPQGSEEWFDMRRIRPTASQFKRIATAKKCDLSASAPLYAAEICGQQLFKSDPDTKWMGNAYTDNGNDREPEAREAFSKKTGLQLEQVGFVTEPCGFYGCSPDSLIKDADGNYIAGLEVKCPSLPVHTTRVLYEKGVPDDYIQQVHGCMIVTGLRTWYFVSYHPRLALYMVKVEWNEYTEKLCRTLDDFRILYAKTRILVDQSLRIGAGEEAA